ncbi:MAG: asparagine synthase (glutamine-hydrolyzing) [Armatimonadetes bacterium]|nr:asparagine synthase (glutamine-hydrolyzing) [Armatimonadota bacterium]
MCGIAGGMGPAGTRDVVQRIVDSQISRGPDFQCVEEVTAGLYFGHDRLSIIDTSDASNQPKWDASRTLCMTFNGEIYNYVELREELVALGHKFTTTGDVEVLLEAWMEWGVDCLQKLNGMFVLAMYDSRARLLHLVRDRFGVKPLLWAKQGDFLFFGSSGKVIAQEFGFEPNLQYLAKGIKIWEYEDESDVSQYTGLHALRSGHYLVVDLESGGVKEECYYDLPSRVAARIATIAGLSETKLMDLVLGELERATKIRLRADVPVGVSLSGGLDSSTLSYLASVQSPMIEGFTFGSPTKSASEGPLVEELGRKIGIKVHYIDPETPEIQRAFLETIQAQDAPFAGPSIIAQYLVYERVKREGVKVLLGGQGGDEDFMGYRKYQLEILKDRWRSKDVAGMFKGLLGALPMVWAERFAWKQYHKAYNRTSENTGSSNLKLPEPVIGTRSWKDARDRQILDIKTTSIPTLLRYEDRNSMAHSVESRLPFMDFQLVELAIALSETLKVRNGYGKWIIRQVMKDKIPDSIRIARYKRGFDVTGRWMHDGLGETIRGHLHSNRAGIEEYFDGEIDSVFSDDHLHSNSTVFTEAMTLSWLAGQQSRAQSAGDGRLMSAAK